MRKISALALTLSAFALVGVVNAETPIHGEFGNHCAMGLTMGKQVPTDCHINWKDPANGNIFCFSSEAMKAEWAKNIPANEKKATAEYTKLTDTKHG